jgi:hypothetical protein
VVALEELGVTDPFNVAEEPVTLVAAELLTTVLDEVAVKLSTDE